MKDSWKAAALVFAGAILSTATAPLFPERHRVLIASLVTIAALLLAFWASGLSSRCFEYLLIRSRQIENFAPRIMILNDLGWDPADANRTAWADRSPDVWKELLANAAQQRHGKVTVRLRDTAAPFAWYSVVVNPYGGVYPERDVAKFATLDKILEYVRHGGIFVNVADVPSFYAYDPALRRRLTVAASVFTGQGFAAVFNLAPLVQRLALNVRPMNSDGRHANITPALHGDYRELHPLPPKIALDRVCEVESNVEPVLAPLKMGDREYGPIVVVNYGRGRFVFSFLFLDQLSRSENEEVPKLLADLVTELLARRRS